MRYRKLKADQLFDGKQLFPDAVLIIAEDGTVQNIVPATEAGEDVEVFKGVLIPGMINCHCHLELSHMKDAIPAGTGLVNFVMNIVKHRGQKESEKLTAIAAAEKEMWEAGIVAVGDICNTIDAIEIKERSNIYFHNLVEVLSPKDETALERIAAFEQVAAKHHEKGQAAVLTPHAPYSISPKTFQEINERTAGQIISVHNQETREENELFLKGTGDFLKMFEAFGNTKSPFEISGKTSLQTWLPYFTKGQTILLVHNTFTSEEDILFAKAHAEKYGLKLFYCLCPNANLYIENQLPPVDLLLKHNCKIVLGTDSYSSNWQLSIAAEMKALQKGFQNLSLATMLQWATANAAEALAQKGLGNFIAGTKPGVVLMNEKDFTAKRIL